MNKTKFSTLQNLDLHLCSLEQLQELKTTITQYINLKQPVLREGLSCTVNHNKVFGMTGIIVKVNRTKVKVDFNGTIFNVPKRMINLNS